MQCAAEWGAVHSKTAYLPQIQIFLLLLCYGVAFMCLAGLGQELFCVNIVPEKVQGAGTNATNSYARVRYELRQ